MEGNQVLNDFEVEDIIGSHYNAEQKKVLYLIKWKGYLQESEWTEEPLEHLPRSLVRSFHVHHPAAAMDDELKRRVRGGGCLCKPFEFRKNKITPCLIG